MEQFEAVIRREDTRTTLVLNVRENEYGIVLTEDKPNNIKVVFNSLLQELEKGEFNFQLNDSKNDLFSHICKEYITQLNAELSSVFKELQDFGLLLE
jgi:hypothetical protein